MFWRNIKMKSKLTKRIISLVLALTLALLPAAAAFGADVAQPAEAKAPYILIRGFMSSDIYAEKGNPDSEKIWGPATNKIVPAVFKLLPSLMGLIITKNYNRFADKAFPVVNELLFPACLDASGNPSNGSGIAWEYPSAEEIKNGADLEFKYDWRLDPTDIVVELDKFVNYVTEVSGSEKVCFECRSFGGVVALTYAGIYGCDKIQSIVFNASAVFGAGFAGELFEGKMTFDDEALTEFFKAVFSYNKNEKLLNGLFAFLKKTGFTGRLCKLLNGLLEECGERLLRESLFPLFGCWPSTWAMAGEDYFADSYDFVFNTVFAGNNSAYAGLMEKVNNFENTIRKNKVEILNEINENCNLYVIAKHGFCSMFMTEAWSNPGDMVLECDDTAFGATVAPYGEKLPDSALAGKDAKYISPAKNIDASTCLFPEQTWFIENITHSKVTDSTLAFTKALLYNDGQGTVDSMSGYSRFMVIDEAADYSLVAAK